MQEYSNENMPKKNKIVLVLIIIGAAILLCGIILSIFVAIAEYNKPIDPDARYNLNFGPIFLLLAVYASICLIVLLPLGIAVYKKGNKWCAIALLALGLLSAEIGGFLCAAAAIVALIQSHEEKKQAERLQSSDF